MTETPENDSSPAQDTPRPVEEPTQDAAESGAPKTAEEEREPSGHSEDLRKLVHTASVLPLFVLPFISDEMILALLAAGFVFNMFILPRL